MNSKKYYKRKGIRKSRQNKRNSRHKRTKQIRRLKKNKTRRSAGMLGRLRGRSKSSWNPPPRNTTNSYTREIVEEKLYWQIGAYFLLYICVLYELFRERLGHHLQKTNFLRT